MVGIQSRLSVPYDPVVLFRPDVHDSWKKNCPYSADKDRFIEKGRVRLIKRGGVEIRYYVYLEHLSVVLMRQSLSLRLWVKDCAHSWLV